MDSIQNRFPTCTHIMVVDFEATCGPGVSKTEAEIIEVGAVLVPLTTTEVSLLELPTFHRYIRPAIVPVLTPFCKKLTGISQKQVDAGILFEQMLEEWITFLSDHHCTTSTVLFGSWTDFDIKQLRREIERSTSQYTFPHAIDLQKSYKVTQKNTSIQSVSKALANHDMEFVGRKHSALHDSQNTTRLLPFCGWSTPLKFTPLNPQHT